MAARRYWYLVIALAGALIVLGAAHFLTPAPRDASPKPRADVPVTQLPSINRPPIVQPAAPPPVPPPEATRDAAVYQYNLQGQLQAILYPDGSVYTYQYDPYGDKIRETTRTGRTWSYVYDQDHRPLSLIDPECHVTHLPISTSAPQTPVPGNGSR
jgi:YD repeat-containing protein